MRLALRYGARVVVSTYNEPLITAEWAVEIFREAKAAGLVTGFVSNGNATPQVLDYIRPWVDLYKVDLKCLDDAHYRQLGGRMQPILDSLRRIHEMGFWLEVVTLIVPGFNDSDEELQRIAAFLAGVSPDIPWHVTAFHPDYKMEGTPATPAADPHPRRRNRPPAQACVTSTPAICRARWAISKTPDAPSVGTSSSSAVAIGSSATSWTRRETARHAAPRSPGAGADRLQCAMETFASSSV